MADPAYGLIFRRYAPFPTFGGGFEGDTRTKPEASFKATARTYGIVMFTQYEILNNFGGSAGTHYDSTVWGDIEGISSVAHTVVRDPVQGPSLIAFKASTSGANPLVPGAPDIDTYVNARFDFGLPGYVRVSGDVHGDNFPNLEVFLHCYQSKHWALLLDGRTTGGRNSGPMTRLAGSHETQWLGSIDAKLRLDQDGLLLEDHTRAPTTME